MVNKYFSSVFSITTGADNINTNDTNTNDMTSSALVESQDAMTEHNDNNNGSASNNNENPHVPDQENCVHDYVISSEHTLQNLEISTEDVLNTLNDMKANTSSRPDNVYFIIFKETTNEMASTLSSLFNKSLRQGLVPADWKTANVTPIFKEMCQKYTWELQAH